MISISVASETCTLTALARLVIAQSHPQNGRVSAEAESADAIIHAAKVFSFYSSEDILNHSAGTGQ
jgi:hypothetical protein